ncbi:MAG: hypothetical protein CVV25_08530 [Ignavibacteriae bacterium HGW-Ignavibacteriae-4]|jgi:multidrug efflux pump subunit AcrB|nr:MAG: hypothetical protein CVV25_08530 [Ignavibacteriae bacterium HGW-Ignavibacteriae-4]
MKKIFYIFLARPITSGMMFLSIIVLGIISVFNIPVELSPHAEFPRLSVSVLWANVSPEAVEAFVTSPIEAELAAIRGIKKITSRSTEGNGYINLEFQPGVNMDFVRIEINEKLHSLKEELPVGINAPYLSDYIPDDLKDLQGFMTYTISGDDNSSTIRKYVVENILYPLRALNGVSDVSIRGGTEREIEIIVDYEKAKSLSVTEEEIRLAVENTENILPAGSIIKLDKQNYIRLANEVSSASELYDQPVKVQSNGTIIRLKDIVSIIDDYKKPSDYYRINGKETVTIIISKEPGTNTLEVAGKVKKKISRLSAVMPVSYEVNKEIDKSESIKEELSVLYSGGIYSLIIIIIVLMLIFRSINYSLIITTSIIFSLLFSFVLFYVFKLPLNILTISSFILGFGFMVDNSIVVIDYLDKHYSGRGIKHITILLNEIFFPVFSSTLTTVAVFVPLLFLTGELRIYFEQFALGIVFTLLASLFVSFTVIPILYFKTLTLNKNYAVIADNRFIYKQYENILDKVIRHKKISFVVAVLLLGLPVWLLPPRIETPLIGPVYNAVFDNKLYDEIKPYSNYVLGGSLNLFFNHITRGEVWQSGEPTYIMVQLELPHGNKIDRINELTKKFENEILEYRNQIKFLTANVYTEENSFIRVEFTEDQSFTAFPYMLKNYLTSFATKLGGLNVSVSGFGPGFYSGGSGMNSFSINVKGFNYLRVRELAEEFRNIIKRNPRVDNVDIDNSGYYWSKDTYEIIGKVNRENLAAAEIPLDYLSTILAKNTSGNIGYNKFRINNDEVSYDIRYSNYKNIQLRELENLILHNPVGNWLKIKDVFSFEEGKVLSAINREDQQYIRYVTFDYKGPYKYGDKFIKASINRMIVPEGYSVKEREFRFRFGDEEEIDIWLILGMAVVLIFMITSGLFESFKKPMIILMAIPYAVIGTIYLFYFGEFNMDRGAYAGILLLTGLSVNNSIVLVDYLSKNFKNGSVNKLFELSGDRLRPIFTTTITTIAALIPLLLSTESTFWKSLSLSVVGGLFLSSLIVVLFVPLLFGLIKK